MWFDLATSFSKGLLLSGTIYSVGIILDHIISNNELEKMIRENSRLVQEGYVKIQTNLLVITPIIYSGVDTFLLDHDLAFSWKHFFSLLLIQNIGYYWMHREMHRNKNLKWMHHFHHRFVETIPSIANSVSSSEFILAYVTPIVTGALLLRPTEISFVYAIGTISLLNLAIHTPQLNNKIWIPGLISPTKHMIHHKECEKHYAAPFLDIDLLIYYWNKLCIITKKTK